MPILHAIVLGITQGLSEFLPISSSGHLIVVPWVFGWDDFDDASPASFLQSLRQGRIVGHHYDAPRQWRPRVVPSTKAL